MSLHVFISHSSEDREVAEQVCDMIEKRGMKCWIAPRNIVPGREYASEIIDAINGCGALVLVLTENANNSKFVAKEVERAVDRGKPVIPLRVREVKPGKSLELFISSSHWIDAFTSPMDAKMDQLESALRPLCEMPPAPARPAAPRPAAAKPAPKPPGKPPLKAIGIGVGALVVLGVAGSLLMGGDEEPARPEPGRTTPVATAEPQARPQASTQADAKPAPQPEPKPAEPAPAPPAELLPPVQAPLPAAESELVAAVGKATGYDRVNAIRNQAANMPAILSEGAIVALLGPLTDNPRIRALDFLASYIGAPLSLDGLEAITRPLQGSDRSQAFERLAAQDVLPVELSAADAARLMQGLGGGYRQNAIRSLGPRLLPISSGADLSLVANPLTGYDRVNAFSSLAKLDKLPAGLRGLDVAPGFRDTNGTPRERMIGVFVPYLAADQSAADVEALLGPLRDSERSGIIELLRNNDKLASNLPVKDAVALMNGESGGYRNRIIGSLAPVLERPLGPADLVALAGPLTGYDRVNAFKALVNAGAVGPLDAGSAATAVEGMDGTPRERALQALAPVMTGPG